VNGGLRGNSTLKVKTAPLLHNTGNSLLGYAVPQSRWPQPNLQFLPHKKTTLKATFFKAPLPHNICDRSRIDPTSRICSTASFISLLVANSKVRKAALLLVLSGSYEESKSVKSSKKDNYVRYYTMLSSAKTTLTSVIEHIRADTAVTFAPPRFAIFSAKCQRKKEWIQSTGGMILSGEMRSTGRKPRYDAILCTIIPKWLVWENWKQEKQYNHNGHNHEPNQWTTVPGNSTLTHVTYLTPSIDTIV